MKNIIGFDLTGEILQKVDLNIHQEKIKEASSGQDRQENIMER